jgi:hypothetical protein
MPPQERQGLAHGIGKLLGFGAHERPPGQTVLLAARI